MDSVWQGDTFEFGIVNVGEGPRDWVRLRQVALHRDVESLSPEELEGVDRRPKAHFRGGGTPGGDLPRQWESGHREGVQEEGEEPRNGLFFGKSYVTREGATSSRAFTMSCGPS